MGLKMFCFLMWWFCLVSHFSSSYQLHVHSYDNQKEDDDDDDDGDDVDDVDDDLLTASCVPCRLQHHVIRWQCKECLDPGRKISGVCGRVEPECQQHGVLLQHVLPDGVSGGSAG